MGVKAKWGPKSFYTSPGRIIPFEGFSTSVTLKSDSENDTSGTEPTNTRGRELQPFSCSTTYHAAAGNDPLAEFHDWAKLVGEKYPLYVGGRRLGPAERFLLKSVDVSDMKQAENGSVLSLTVSLSFTEYSEGKSSKLASVSGGTSGSTTSDSPTASDVVRDESESLAYSPANAGRKAAHKEAMNATASKADKSEKKTGGGGRGRIGAF